MLSHSVFVRLSSLRTAGAVTKVVDFFSCGTNVRMYERNTGPPLPRHLPLDFDRNVPVRKDGGGSVLALSYGVLRSRRRLRHGEVPGTECALFWPPTPAVEQVSGRASTVPIAGYGEAQRRSVRAISQLFGWALGLGRHGLGKLAGKFPAFAQPST